MKRSLAIIFLSLVLSYPLSSTSHAGDPYVGTGEVKLSYGTIKNFKQYVRNNNKQPSAFIITTDGTGSYYIYCPYGQCQSLKKKYRIPVGFSDHTNGNLSPIVSVMFGACMIEKHFNIENNYSLDSFFSSNTIKYT